MKKFLLTIALAAGLLLPFATKAQSEAYIVANGTMTNNYVPIYFYYADSYLRCQTIYPASMLTEIQNTPISGIEYYLNYYTGPDTPLNIFQIKMGVCTGSTFSYDFDNSTALTTVYTGTVSVTNNVMTITFDAPFTYTSGNLLVEFDCTPQENYFNGAFYGIVSEGSSFEGYGENDVSSIDGDVQDFIPQTGFMVPATCSKPVLDAPATTGTSATFSWTGTASSYAVNFNGGATEIVTGNSYAATGLTPVTLYTFNVRSICGAGDTSYAATTAFTTPCGDMVLPYTNDFENDESNESPACWTMYSGDVTIVDYYYPHSGEKCALFESNGTLISSYIPTPANQLHLEFYLAREDEESGSMIVGYTTSNTSLADMVTIATITPTDNNYHEYSYDLTSLPATPGYLVFKQNSEEEFYYYFLDDIAIELASDCERPATPAVANVTPTSADLSWTVATPADSYEVAYGTVNNANSTQNMTATTTATSMTLTGLTPHTAYYAWVRSICGGTPTRWTAFNAFTTQQSCAMVENATVNSTTRSGASISWDRNTSEGAPITEIIIEYKEASASAWNEVRTTNNYYMFSGLESATNYEVRIMSLCTADTAEAVSLTFSTDMCTTEEITGGTPSEEPFPISQYYKYGYSQMLYPDSELSGVTTINGVAFEYVGTSECDIKVDVYLADVVNENPGTGDWVPGDSLTLVASNYWVHLTPGWVNIPFDTDFTHTAGKNLVVAVDNNTGRYFSSSQCFSNHQGDGREQHDDSYNLNPMTLGQIGNSTGYVPDVKFGVPCTSEGCMPPLVATNGITDNSVQLTWTAGGSESQWVVEYKVSSESEWTTAATVSSTSYLLSNLSSGTFYSIRVGAICGSENAYNTINIFTNCGNFALPYTEDFTSGEFNPCWTVGTTSTSLWSDEPYIDTWEDAIYCYDAGGYVVLPEFTTPATGLQLTLNASYDGWDDEDAHLAVGIVSDPDDFNTFTLIDTLTIPGDGVPVETLTYFNTYTGTGNHIAFQWLDESVYVYDLTVEVASSCHKPTGLRAADATSSSIVLSWNCTESNYEVSYTIAGENNWTTVSATTNPFTLTGLSDATEYEVKVRSVCSASEASAWSSSTTFKTKCNPIAITLTESYTQSFDDGTMPICWEENETVTVGEWNYSNGMAQEGSGCAIFEGYDGGISWLYSPIFDCSALNNGLQLSLWYMLPEEEDYGDTYHASFEIHYRTSATDEWTMATYASDVREEWTNLEYNMPNSTNAAYYQIAIKGMADYDYTDVMVYLDNLVLEATPTCARPTNITLTSAGATTATLTWSSNAPSAEVQYRKAGTSSWTTVQATGNSVTLNGLTSGTAYEIQVRANCSETDQSPYSTIYTFNTGCYDDAIASFPWVEGFENGVLCWQQETIAGNDLWTTQTGDGDGSYHQIDRAYSGSKNAAFYSPNLTTNNSTRMISPALNITSLSNPYLKFAHAQTAYSGINDKLMLYYRASATSNWVSLTSFTSAIANWTVDSIALPGASAEYQIAFVGTFMGGNGVIIDQVTVYNNSTAPGPNPPQGIEEAEGSMNLSIYPNPASGSTTLTLNGVNGKVNITIVDMSGRSVMKETVECHENCAKQIQVGNLSQGAYFVRVNGEKVNIVKKLIVR